MADVLSQSEIDALLSALSSGEVDIEENQPEEKFRVKKYDFKRPNKFSKDHIRTLDRIHENFARLGANYLSAHLRTSVQMNLIASEQITFEEFIRSVPNPTILMSYYLEPFPGIIMFETGPHYVMQVIDILFGGLGKSIIKTREFTDIEKNVIKRINLKLLENLKIAWEDVLDVQVQCNSLETNPALNQIMSPNEAVNLITIAVEINGNQSLMNMCIPYMSVEKYIDKLVLQYKATSHIDYDENNYKTIEKRISKVDVNVHVELGKTMISVGDFLNIGVGDCLKLKTEINNTMDMYIENKGCFKVLPGTVGKKLGVQIVEKIDKDVEDNE